MDPQDWTLLALVVLGISGIIVAITGFIHLRRLRSVAGSGSTGVVPPVSAEEES